jgi:hypothetical protein
MGAYLSVVFVVLASMLLTSVVESAFAASSSSLKVLIKVTKTTINVGDTQKISIKVTDDKGKSLKGATISVIISNPGDKTIKKFTGKTDSNGVWSLSYKMEQKTKSGLAGIDVKVTKAGYDNGYASAFYKIVVKKQK